MTEFYTVSRKFHLTPFDQVVIIVVTIFFVGSFTCLFGLLRCFSYTLERLFYRKNYWYLQDSIHNLLRPLQSEKNIRFRDFVKRLGYQGIQSFFKHSPWPEQIFPHSLWVVLKKIFQSFIQPFIHDTPISGCCYEYILLLYHLLMMPFWH